MTEKEICSALSKAIHENKWLDIQYRQESNVTRFWFALEDIQKKTGGTYVLIGKLYNITKKEKLVKDAKLNPEKIISAVPLMHSTYPSPISLIQNIEKDPQLSLWLRFDELKKNILAYYLDCNLLDNDPYQKETLMIEGIDVDALAEANIFRLNDSQEKQVHGIVEKYNSKYHPLLSPDSQRYIKDLRLIISNIAIIHRNKKYIIAYQNLFFDPSNKSLILDSEIQLNQSFVSFDKDEKGKETKETLHLFGYIDMDAGEFLKILQKDRKEGSRIIHDGLKKGDMLSTQPEIMVLERSILANLQDSFATLNEEYSKGNLSGLSYPIKAFFGNSTRSFYNHARNVMVVLYDRHININQMNVVYKSMRYPLNYVKGPPGTGKTQTLLNVVLSAFFSGKTVMVTSGNNKPVDGIREKLRLTANGKKIPFPCLRLGNSEKTAEAMEVIDWVYQNDFKSEFNQKELEFARNSNDFTNNALYGYMKAYSEKEDQISRGQKLKSLLHYDKEMSPELCDRIKQEISQIEQATREFKEISNDDLSRLYKPFTEDPELQKVFYDLSVYHLSLIHGPKYKDLMDIVSKRKSDKERAISAFNHWISNDANLALLLKVFPVILTTNISSSHLGTGKSTRFDLVIMDEAGQCNVAHAILPIMRGNQLLLVGDTSQLKPVILLNPCDNQKLMSKYQIDSSYSYLGNSIMSTMRANDQISNYIMLRYHYRCGRKIIRYSNARFYNNEMNLNQLKEEGKLELVKTRNYGSYYRNANEQEAEAVVKYITDHNLTKATILTPFVNQENLINEKLSQAGIQNIHCGTIHSMQGAEDDIVIFSPSVSIQTTKRAFQWLCNNSELINVGVTRAKKALVIIGDVDSMYKQEKESNKTNDDLMSLIDYVAKEGNTTVEKNLAYSESIGYSNHSKFEDEFCKTMLQYCSTKERVILKRNIKVRDVFPNDPMLAQCGMEYDEVIYLKKGPSKKAYPVVAIEINGPEHYTDVVTMECDKRKKELSQQRGIDVVYVKNEDVQDYESIKEIINSYLGKGE